jgi:hypothetical protein
VFLRLIKLNGHAGFVVPTGISTDNSTKAFFKEIVSAGRLLSLFAFDNQRRVFPAVHPDTPFALVTLWTSQRRPQLAFYLLEIAHLGQQVRRYFLSADEIRILNPNTRTCPVFRTGADAELAKTIYRRVPVLMDDELGEAGNPWGISIHTRLFHMTEDAVFFLTARQLVEARATRFGAHWLLHDGLDVVQLYESKMIHHFDHCWATFESDGTTTRDLTASQKSDPTQRADPR